MKNSFLAFIEIIMWILTIFSDNIIDYIDDLRFSGRKSNPEMGKVFLLKLYYILIAKILCLH